MKRFLWRWLKVITKIFLLVKMILVVRSLMRSQKKISYTEIKDGLGDVYDEETGSFHIMNEVIVTASCGKSC